MNKNTSEKIRVLIVEDETIPAHYLKGIIEEDNEFLVEWIVPSAEGALDAIKTLNPQIIFMDIMIEGALSGAELAVMIRKDHPNILILFVTAYSNEEMVEYAAEAEAFAYLLKPYRPREIHATLRLAAARLRKPAADSSDSTEMALVDGFVCHTDTFQLYREKQEVILSAKEAALIQILCRHHHTLVTSDMIRFELGISDASLRSLIYRLRKLTSQHLIRSVKRAGYCLGKEKVPE
jgi:DNA-binding response OmpR family regulator